MGFLYRDRKGDKEVEGNILVRYIPVRIITTTETRLPLTLFLFARLRFLSLPDIPKSGRTFVELRGGVLRVERGESEGAGGVWRRVLQADKRTRHG